MQIIRNRIKDLMISQAMSTKDIADKCEFSKGARKRANDKITFLLIENLINELQYP